MFIRDLFRIRRFSIVLVTVVLTVGAPSCCSTSILRAPGGRAQLRTEHLSKANLKCDVQIVAVMADGTTIPKLVQVRKDVEIVIWVADADQLDIQFVGPNPFPQPVVCPGGRFCGALLPPNANYGQYEYKGTVKIGNETHKLDPHLEVVR